MHLKYILLITLFIGFTAAAQTPKQAAAEKCKQALALEDEGGYVDALSLLSEAQKLDPTNTTYPYETAYVWYLQKQYQRVADKLITLKDKTDTFDRVYQLLGKCYVILNENAKADQAFEEGLKKFPKAGCLYLEKGMIQLDNKSLTGGLVEFEKGIDADPAFPDNYYWAAKLYCNSDEPIWGMIYGELFMNLVRNGDQNEEISKLLYDTYTTQITYNAQGNLAVKFSKPHLVDGKPKKTFGSSYDAGMYIATLPHKIIDINTLDEIRQGFYKFYFDNKLNIEYPNALYNYQEKLTKAGCIDAYNHWLLMYGDRVGFKIWKAQNPSKWQEFTKWFGANPLKLDDGNKFVKTE